MAESLQAAGVDLHSVEALGTRHQNNEWFVTFTSIELQEAFLSMGVLKVGDKNGYISSLDSTSHRIRVHWAPYHISNHTLRDKLETCLPEGASIMSLGFERSQIKGLEHVATMVRYAVIRYPGPSSQLPHLLTVSQENEVVEVLLTIQGREPICLRCRQVGHVRSSCDTPYCSVCKKMGHHHSSCKVGCPSYATATRPEAAEADEPAEEGRMADPGDEETGGDRVPPESSSLEKATSPSPEDFTNFPPLKPASSIERALNMVSPSPLQDEVSSDTLGASLPCGQPDPQSSGEEEDQDMSSAEDRMTSPESSNRRRAEDASSDSSSRGEWESQRSRRKKCKKTH